jgi:hypothetical protein
MRHLLELILILGRFIRATLRHWNVQKFSMGIRFLFVFCVTLGLYAWDPLGVGVYTKQATTELVSAILSPTTSDEARDEITIVLFDDQFVQRNDWPVEFSVHAKALKKIATFNPAAIYVDLLFIETAARRDWLTLRLTLLDLKERGIPVFLAAAQTRRNPLFQGFLSIEPDDPNQEPTVKLVGTDFDPATAWLSYELAPKFTNSGISPALALFQAYCSSIGRVKDPNQACDSKTLLSPERVLKDLPTLAMVWGLTPSEANEGAFVCNENIASEENKQKGLGNTLVQILRQIANLISLEKRDREEFCPRYPTVLYENLKSDFGTQTSLTASEEPDSESTHTTTLKDSPLWPYFNNKLVIYGSDIEGSSVFVDPPTHQLLPTPYMHATALEGLLQDGDQYLRFEEGLFGRKFPMTFSEILAVALLAYFYAKTLKPSRRTIGQYQRGQYEIYTSGLIPALAIGGAIWFLFLLIVSSLAAVQLYINSIFPFDLIGILALMLLLRGFRNFVLFKLIEVKMLKFGNRATRSVRRYWRNLWGG